MKALIDFSNFWGGVGNCPRNSWLDLSWCITHTRLTALFPGLPRWAGTRKAKPIWILLKQETVSGSGISWAICKYAPSCWQITMPTSHHSFYRPDALLATQPTVPKHWSWCISVPKNDTDVRHYSFDVHKSILIIFGRSVRDRACYQTIVYFPTSPD